MGTVFLLGPPTSPGGSLTGKTLYSFPKGYGSPGDGVVIGSAGEIFGDTFAGGPAGHGTVFALTPPSAPDGAWNETVLYGFPGVQHGVAPAGVVIGSGGVLYGVTCCGGAYRDGTVFSLTPPMSPGTGWTYTVLHNFTGFPADGWDPNAAVTIGSGGVLYGTASSGGAADYGTVFSLTPPASAGGTWTETLLYSFAAGNDGCDPLAGVVIGPSGVLYGTTPCGGTSQDGTVFSLTPPALPGGTWTEAVLYSFTGGLDGGYPYAGVAIGSGGVLYGTTEYGGSNGLGTVFSLNP